MAPQITPALQSIRQEIEPLLAANDRAALRSLLAATTSCGHRLTLLNC